MQVPLAARKVSFRAMRDSGVCCTYEEAWIIGGSSWGETSDHAFAYACVMYVANVLVKQVRQRKFLSISTRLVMGAQ